MNLGELQGQALIGRPLELSLPFQTTADEALSEGCVRATIYFGEIEQKSPHLSIQANQLRLQLSEPVNEPIVKVQIRTFCGASQIRNYVLLADLPPDSSAGAVAPTLPTAAPVRPETASTERAPAKAKRAVPTARKQASSVGKNKKFVKRPKPKAKVAAPKRPRDPRPASTQQAKSVLKLDPLEILSDRMDNLELNMPFVPAEDALLQSRQIAALQAEVKSMRELAVKNDNALLQLSSQLQQAQSQQASTRVLYGLIALLLMGLAGLAWLWQSQKKLSVAAQSWWQQSPDGDLKAFLQPEVQAAAAKPTATLSTTSPAEPPKTLRPADALPLASQNLAAPDLATTQNELLPATPTEVLQINPESIQDIRQHADFFISLGQDDRAIEILSQYLAASELPNPLICIDLLGLYRQANQIIEFDQLREFCHQHFNVQLPELALYEQEGQDLASYPEILSTLTRLWPSEQAQAFMDRCIFLKAATRPQARLDLAAFRDLLSLHALVEELAMPLAPANTTANAQTAKTGQPFDRAKHAQVALPGSHAPANTAASPPTQAFKTQELDLDFVLPEHPVER